MIPRITTVISSLLLTFTASAQSASLLFVPKKLEVTRHTTGSPALRGLPKKSVAIVEPGGSSCSQTAHKFVPGVAFQTLVGDEDGDGDVHTRGMFDSIEALLVRPYQWDPTRTKFVARTAAISARDVYITPKIKLGTNVSGAPGLRPCDSGSITADGQIRYFIRGEQIISALGMVDQERQPLAPEDISIDAITVDMSGTVYLSFEETHMFQLMCGTLQTYTVLDGAVLMIPAGSLTFGFYGNVTAAQANSGRVLFSEATIDQMVKHAKVKNHNGSCPERCFDTDGLALDPRGGTMQYGWCNYVTPIPNLLFTTAANTGAGVLSTRNYGEIARLNGCPLAKSCGMPGGTTGQQVGLKATGSVGSLNGLAVARIRPFRFTLYTTDPASLDRNCEWYIGSSMNIKSVLLYAGNGALPISPAWNLMTKLGLTTNSFPEVFPNAFTYGPINVPMVSDGWGGRVGKFTFPVPSAIAPNGLITQVFSHYSGRWQASTPMTFVK